MAATSTNKQPLLVDHVLHYVVNLDTSINDGMDIVGTNTAALIIDGTNSDGAIVEDIYTISRGTTASEQSNGTCTSPLMLVTICVRTKLCLWTIPCDLR